MDDPLSPLDAYLLEVERHPRLSAEQEAELARRAAGGDVAAKRELVRCNLRLVVAVAQRHAETAAPPLLDLIQEGNIGLLRAVDRYDQRRASPFSTYATRWIREAIRRRLRG